MPKKTTTLKKTEVKTLSPFVIFLDIDGVLYNTPNQDGVFKKVGELFPHVKKPYNNYVCSIAASYFFNKTALENLHTLIKDIEKIRPIWIVLSSAWREKRSLKQIKEIFFEMHEFSKYIVDKTPEDMPYHELELYCPAKEHTTDSYCYICRASEIGFWLKQYPEIESYVVIDDYDQHLLKAYGKRYIQTDFHELLTKEHCKKILKMASTS